MRYVYFPTGRELWRELPAVLEHRFGWVPTIWLGDDRHQDWARERFSDCAVYGFAASNEGVSVSDGSSAAPARSPFQLGEADLAGLKLRALKMMDRRDLQGDLRLLEREATFYQLYSYFSGVLGARMPEVLVAAEAPHSPPQLIIYELMRSAGLPRIHFVSANFLPVLFPKREIDGRAVCRGAVHPALEDARFESDIDELVEGFEQGDYAAAKPRYMTRQAVADVGGGVGSRVKREIRMGAGLARRGWREPGAIRGGQSPEGPKRWAMTERARSSGALVASWLSQQAYRRRTARALETAYRRCVESAHASGEYVLFPLHYEPERTTNPEGGRFWNQYDVALELRSALPDSMELWVREHPSQFSKSMKGHRGRSPGFYEFIDGLPNTRLVSHEIDPITLVRGSSLVATVGGTIALEAAVLGQRAVIFGHPWFEGCPGVTSYSGADSILESLKPADHGAKQVRDFLVDLVRECGIPGCVNPSNEEMFSRYDDLLAHPEAVDWIATAVSDALQSDSDPER